MLSATALIGLFEISRFFIITFDLFDKILLFHLRGLNGLIGVTAIFFEFKLSIGPCTDKL